MPQPQYSQSAERNTAVQLGNTEPSSPLGGRGPTSSVCHIGYFGYQNLGDEAILASLIGGLRDRLGAEISPTVLSGDPALTKTQHSVKAVASTLPGSLRDFVVRGLGRNRRSFFSTLYSVTAADVVVVGGGGLFYDSPESNGHLCRLFFHIRACKWLGKKVAIVGVTIGPFHHEESRKLLAQSFRNVDLIAVRDQESQTQLRSLGITSFLTADLAILLEPCSDSRIFEILQNEAVPMTDGPLIGLSFLGWQLGEKAEILKQLCRSLVQQHGARLMIVPMQTDTAYSDRPALKSFATEVGATMISQVHSPEEITGLLSVCDVVLSERLHGAILALAAGTPFLGLSYMPKVQAFFQECDLPDLVFHNDEGGIRSAFQCLEKFLTQPEHAGRVRNRVRSAREALLPRAAENIDLLENLIRTTAA